MSSTRASQRAEGRECGSCSLCCKLIAVEELAKPEGVWCPNCSVGKARCTVYDNRPSSCLTFHCGWLQTHDLGAEWQPTRSKMVVAAEGDGNRITVYVDPGFPTQWQTEPYNSQLMDLAIGLAEQRKQLIVRIVDRVIVLLPDRIVDLGSVKKEDHIIVARDRRTGEWDARLILAKDVPLDQKGKWVDTFNHD